MNLWTSAELKAHYGITGATLHKWRGLPAFPPPVKELPGRGYLWDRDAVIAWKRVRDRPHLGKKAGCISAWKHSQNITLTATRNRIPYSTLRGWLIEGGHIPPPTKEET